VSDLRIGQVARELCVSTEFLRALERTKRIPAPLRDAGGRRVYTQGDLDLLRAIGIGSRPTRLKRAEEAGGAGA
jgi:DNA-binding transcriptional MerR regulator